MMSVTPSSSKPPDPRWDYDIFVSFIRDKTSCDFLYYLFGGLGRNGIVTFRPPPSRGENIPTLAIQRSRNFMVVLSQDYLSSEYCLNELVEIVDRRNIKDHIFFPILYQLGPSDVQKRIETLEVAFPMPEGQFGTSVDQRMQGWRAALTEVMNSSDQILHDDANGSMGILKFVEEVLDVVCTRLIIPRNTLRMDSCVEMMTAFLNLGTSEIYIVGMSCVDKLIKETLIEVVYSQIHNRFERTSFISNISEISISPSGLFGLQEELLGDMGGNEVNIKNGDEGISLIEEAIQGKRVLIVLDNVDELKQLHTLIGNSKCFGPGSRVIAVSRENQLRAELEAHGIYDVEDLPEWKSPQLSIWRASMMAHPAKYFSGKKDHYLQRKFFGHEKEFLSEDPAEDSSDDYYHDLQPISDEAKDFPDKKDHYLQLKNEGHDYEVKFDPDPNLDLSAAEDFWDGKDLFLPPTKLLSAGEGSEKQITLQPDEEVVFDITRYYRPASQTLDLTWTRIRSLPKSIFGLVGLKRLILRNSFDFVKLPPEVGELEQLEVLDLEGTQIRDLPENLRCPMLLELSLHRNPKLIKIPPSFFDYMPALQILNLSHTNIKSLPKSIVKLVSLKRLILSYCINFVKLPPEVGELEQLEVLHLEETQIINLPENLRCPMLLELDLHNSPMLTMIPPSFFDYMPALQILNVSQTNISSLPKSIVKLVSLKRLILNSCKDVVELPPEVGELEQLEVLHLKATNIRNLPENLRCPMLLELYLCNYKELSTIPPSFFNYMPALQTLDLSYSNISSLPKSIVKLVSLKRLILSYCKDFVELPPEVGELEQLEVLHLEGTKIRDLPENLRCPMLLELYLHNNKELSTIPPSFFNYMPALQILNVSETKISSLPKSIVKLVSLKRLILCNGENFARFPPEVGELEQLEVLHLEETQIINLPENLRCPMLLELDLHNSPMLTMIPPSFFDYMPALQILNLSHTNIKSLPKSIVKLVSLKRLILSYCINFVKLPPEVGELEQLEVLHLEGTKIRDLPENLRCPMLLELHLYRNPILRRIPPSFFDYMPALQILDVSETNISSLPKSIVKLVSLKRLILSCRLLSIGGEVKQLKVLELKGRRGIRDLHERFIDLEGKDLEILHLPAENPSHHEYFAVFLHNNLKLKTIPTSFFNYMPFLEVLNLSRTGIRSLPKSIFRLDSLKILILSYCHRFLGLSPEVGKLKRLEVLDLEGTEIMDLPKEIKELNNLTCLNLSFYGYMGDGSCSVMESDAVFPRGVIKALFRLEVLMISVNPDDKWWNECVEDIVTEACNLMRLKTLVFFFPRVELVRHVLRDEHSRGLLQSHFRFIVGHHVKRIMSRRPRGVELELEEWERCLEYINGDQAIPEEIKTLLQYSTAFFLERHATVKKLSDFGNENMKQLKCCVVGECNEVEVIIDEVEASSGIVLGSLEYLCIYYMKNLRSIWEGPIQTKCLSLLKFLTLRTCPELTTIFTTGLLDNLCNLENLIIDDCPSLKTLVSCEVSTEHKASPFLPNLKRMSLHYMPGLVSISSGLHIAPRLELLSFYDCPNLKNLLIEEVSSKDLKKIEGERSWWEALEWSTDRPAYLDDIFVLINIEDC